MKSTKKETVKSSETVMGNANKEYKELVLKASKSPLINKNALGFDKKTTEAIYCQAYRLYNSGKNKEALEQFKLLALINPLEWKYMLGLAACFQRLKIYDEAIEAYSICASLDLDDPTPFYYASDCFIHMDDKLAAMIVLEMAIKRAGNNPDYQKLKERAQFIIDSFEGKK